MASFTDQLPNILTSLQGLWEINQGASIAEEGAEFEASMALAAGDMAATLATQAGAVESAFALQGAKINADGYRRAAKDSLAIAGYNMALTKVNAARQSDIFSREVEGLFTANLAKTGASGLNVGSRSFLAVAHENMAQAERMYGQMKANEDQKLRQLEWQGKMQATDFENKARLSEYQGQANSVLANYRAAAEASAAKYNAKLQAAGAEYRGQVASYQADVQMGQNLGGMISNITSLFGG